MDQLAYDILDVVAKRAAYYAELDARVCEVCGRTGDEGCDDEAHVRHAVGLAQEIYERLEQGESIGTFTEPFNPRAELERYVKERATTPPGQLIGEVLLEVMNDALVHIDHQNGLVTCNHCEAQVSYEAWEDDAEVVHEAWCLTKDAEHAIHMLLDTLAQEQTGETPVTTTQIVAEEETEETEAPELEAPVAEEETEDEAPEAEEEEEESDDEGSEAEADAE